MLAPGDGLVLSLPRRSQYVNMEECRQVTEKGHCCPSLDPHALLRTTRTFPSGNAVSLSEAWTGHSAPGPRVGWTRITGHAFEGEIGPSIQPPAEQLTACEDKESDELEIWVSLLVSVFKRGLAFPRRNAVVPAHSPGGVAELSVSPRGSW